MGNHKELNLRQQGRGVDLVGSSRLCYRGLRGLKQRSLSVHLTVI